MNIESNKTSEIELLKLVSIIKERIFYIICITITITLASFIYLSNLSKNYSTSVIITSITINDEERLNQELPIDRFGIEFDSRNVLNDFLIFIQSENFQKKVLNEFDYSNLLDLQKDKNEYELQAKSLINSIDVSLLDSKNFLGDVYKISIKGQNPNLITSYINDLIEFTNNLLISQIEERIELSMEKRIDEVNYEIFVLNLKNDTLNLEDIKELERELQIAINLGSKNSNFKSINTNINPPNWFLLGEDAIKEKIKSIKNKINYPPKSEAIIELESEKDFLKQLKVNLDGFNAIETIKRANIPQSPYEPNIEKFMFFAFFASFLGSIFLFIFLDLFKQYERNQ